MHAFMRQVRARFNMFPIFEFKFLSMLLGVRGSPVIEEFLGWMSNDNILILATSVHNIVYMQTLFFLGLESRPLPIGFWRPLYPPRQLEKVF